MKAKFMLDKKRTIYIFRIILKNCFHCSKSKQIIQYFFFPIRTELLPELHIFKKVFFISVKLKNITNKIKINY